MSYYAFWHYPQPIVLFTPQSDKHNEIVTGEKANGHSVLNSLVWKAIKPDCEREAHKRNQVELRKNPSRNSLSDTVAERIP
jgi:hypothetical protein